MDVGDVDPDPIVQFRRWQADVLDAGLPEPTTMVLATTPAGERSQPLARLVLLKGVDERGFSWVSNQRSRKGRHLAANPHACLLFPWYPLGRQVIVTGQATVAAAEESDDYFATRPRESQISAWASEQSEPVPDRAALERRWAELAERFADGPIERPPWWGMYRLVPDTVELWAQGLHRMHDRLLYELDDAGAWRITRLSP